MKPTTTTATPAPFIAPPTATSLQENDMAALLRMRSDREAMGRAALALDRYLVLRSDQLGVSAVFRCAPRDDGSLQALEPVAWAYGPSLLEELRGRAEFDVEGDRQALARGARYANGTPMITEHITRRVDLAVERGLAVHRHAFAGLVTSGLGALIDPTNASRTLFGKPHRGAFRVAHLPSAGVLVVAELTREQAVRGEWPTDLWERPHDRTVVLRGEATTP